MLVVQLTSQYLVTSSELSVPEQQEKSDLPVHALLDKPRSHSEIGKGDTCSDFASVHSNFCLNIFVTF